MIGQHVTLKKRGAGQHPYARLTLSTYFPENTVYFYGYPSGEDSKFLNLVDAYTEETVAARASVIAGSHVKALVFKASTMVLKNKRLTSIPSLKSIRGSMIPLPKEIDGKLSGKARNEAIKEYIRHNIEDASLIMAQPFTDSDIKSKFLINPELTVWLNDKKNMRSYIPENFLPKTYAQYKNGKELNAHKADLKVPVAIKVSSSSAGDGVYLCTDENKLLETCNKLKDINGSIIVEELVKDRQNYGVQFGIPYDKSKDVDIIGASIQITSPEGEFLGGLIDSSAIPLELQSAVAIMKQKILPFARELGWYGIGCFDVLIDEEGSPKFIDCNFRMTGMSAFLLTHKAVFGSKLVSFSGTFKGTSEQFYTFIEKYTNQKNPAYLNVVSVTKNSKTWRINAGIVFKSKKDCKKIVTSMWESGLTSQGLNQLYNKNYL